MKTRPTGFSLVVSLVLMTMLCLLAIGAVSLLAIELRLSQASVSAGRARLNALAGARIAVGEIQRHLGPDRRVSANAAILSPDGALSTLPRPRLTGVWNGRVVAERYAEAHRNEFRGWLTSGADASGASLSGLSSAGSSRLLQWAGSDDAAPDFAKEWRLSDVRRPYAGAPKLGDVAEGARTLGLYAVPEALVESGGALAWLATDENQKARVDLHDYDNDGYDLPAQRATLPVSAARRFHPGHAAERFPAAWSASLPKPATVVSWRSLATDRNAGGEYWMASDDSSPGSPDAALRHDFTTDSVSLLTDGVNGGLKHDVNLLALLSDADFDALPGIGFAGPGEQGWLGAEPGRDAWRAGGERGYVSALATFKPWESGPNPADGANAVAPNVARRSFTRWADVREWARLSGDAATPAGPVLGMSGGAPVMTMPDVAEMRSVMAATAPGIEAPDRLNHVYWRMPAMYRTRAEFHFDSAPSASQPGKYELYMKVNYVLQLWNPYNVRLRMNPGDLLWLFSFTMPFEIRGYKNGAAFSSWWITSSANFNVNVDMASGAPVMEPGEIRTYSLPPSDKYVGTGVTLQPGYNPLGGMRMPQSGTAHIMDAGTTVSYSLHAKAGGSLGNVQFYRGPSIVSSGIPTNTYIGEYGNANNPAIAPLWLKFYPDQNAPATVTSVGPVDGVTPDPVVVFDLRLKTEAYAARGVSIGDIYLLHQSSYSVQGNANAEAAWNRLPFESVVWDTAVRNVAEDPNALQVASGAGSPGFLGYGLTGNTAGRGLSHPVFYPVPLRPPVGLLDLRDARLSGGARPTPRGGVFIYDQNKLGYSVHRAFGNSLAHPAVPQDAVFTAVPTDDAAAFIGNGIRPSDQSWYLNTVLADTWFCSSLGDWNSGVCASLFGVGKNYPQLLDAFLSGTRRLPNRRFAPSGAGAEPGWIAGTRATPAAFENLASRMVVEGGFNVNSTSVRAWRAFLASTRDTDYPLLKSGHLGAAKSTNAKALALPEPVEKLLPPDGSSYARRVNGGREISDDRLDDLAVAMVAQVRKRGPFLSVGEFLNRRIEAGESGRMGAVQAAIEASGLNGVLARTGRAATGLRQPNTEIEKTYAFSGVGNPGWLAQADLLAPLASALTARGDTFVIRAAGESPDGARAYVELTVRRTTDFLDSREKPSTATAALERAANKTFGRRFVITAARFLSPDEI